MCHVSQRREIISRFKEKKQKEFNSYRFEPQSLLYKSCDDFIQRPFCTPPNLLKLLIGEVTGNKEAKEPIV
jgi:hypothetical protein